MKLAAAGYGLMVSDSPMLRAVMLHTPCMQAVRDGTMYKQEQIHPEIDIADNLQALAGLVTSEPSPKPQSPTRASPKPAAAAEHRLPAVEDSYSNREAEIEQDIWAAAARTATQQEQEELQELQRQIELEQQQQAADAAAYEAYKQEVAQQVAECQQQQDKSRTPGAATAVGQGGQQVGQQEGVAAAAVHEDDEGEDGFEGTEVHQQYLELEREVQQMLEATTAVAAAAERLQSPSDQQYLSQILGEWSNCMSGTQSAAV